MCREQVEDHGFAIIPYLLTNERIARLVEDLEQVMLRRSRAGVRHALQHPVFAALASELPLLDIAREVLGGEAFPYHATLFDKSPDANWLVVWHQDTALPLRERQDVPGWGPWSVKEGMTYAHAPESALRRVLALRVHLDNSTAKNGPLRVLPGTHTSGVLSDDAIHQLAAEVSPVDCLVPQGGVLAMRPLLVHSSSKSQISNPRRVLHIEYATSRVVAPGLELAAGAETTGTRDVETEASVQRV